MHIPLVDLKSQYEMIKDEIDEAIQRVVDRTIFIGGEEVAAFDREFAEYCETEAAIGVSSGTEALRLALIACDVGPGDEVITAPSTFIATVEAIAQVGATPVFVDVEEETNNIDPDLIEAAITSRTRAVIPIHLYGYPADMDRICDVAKRHSLKVIEDAAQAHGARYKGRRVGGFGDAGCFSFYPGKNLGAYGDAGAVVTNDQQVAQRVRLLRDHGRRDKYEHLILGYNSRIDAIQAAILRVKLRQLDRWNDARRSINCIYRELLQDSHVSLQEEGPTVEPVYHLFVIRSNDRDQLRESLDDAGISTGIHYPIPLHLQPALWHLGYKRGDFPVSEEIADKVVSLPMFPELSQDTAQNIAAEIVEVRKAWVTKSC